LFALDKIDSFDVLYLPPPGKHRDLGPTALLAADRYCRRRGAMLVVDPPAGWQSANDAVAGIRELGLASPNMVSYFPRARRREDPEAPPRAAGAAVAGLLCKLDRQHGAWQEMDAQGLKLDRALIPAMKFDDEQIHSMVREGLNVFAAGPADVAQLRGSVTLSRGSDSQRYFNSLPVRRCCLQILGTIEHATRWAVFEHGNALLAKRVRAQVTTYLACLADLGAFAEEHFIVECDAGLRKADADVEHGFAIFVAFHVLGCAEPMSFTLHQSVAGCRIASTAFAPADSGLQT
jgi:phage tail sheath protein FI